MIHRVALLLFCAMIAVLTWTSKVPLSEAEYKSPLECRDQLGTGVGSLGYQSPNTPLANERNAT